MSDAVPFPGNLGTGEVMRLSELARRDQAEAREREFDRRVVRAARVALVLVVVLSAWAFLVAYGVLPAMPWSPLGMK